MSALQNSSFTGEGNPGAGLIYNGHVIHDRDDMLSLTDMWRAQGSDKSRQPSEWIDSADGKRFCETAAEILNPLKNIKPGISGFEQNQLVITKKGGNNAGTWAHWQIGLAYAKYLSPEFHMWCNSVVRAHMEKAQAPALTDHHIYNLLREFTHWRADQTRELAEMKEQINAVVEVVTPSVPGVYRIVGETPGNILKAEGVPDRIRGLAHWFGDLLEKAGIQPTGRKADKTRLFPQDQAAAFLKNGGMATVHRYIAEKKGQGALAIPGMNKRRMKKMNAQGRGVIGMDDEAVTFQAGMTVCPGEEALLVMSQDGLHFGIGTRTMTGYDVTKTTRFGPPQGAMGMMPIFIVVGRVIDRQPMH